MKKILSNGVSIVCKQMREFEEISLTVKVGHVNEPRVGIASVYEKIVSLNSPELASILGGTITSFVVRNKGGVTVNQAVKTLFNSCIKIVITPAVLAKAVDDIVRHTEDLAPLAERQVKLAYKHTAFGASDLWSTEEYIAKLKAITVEDVQKFIHKSFCGSNIVIGYCGPDIEDVESAVQKHFGWLGKGDQSADCNLAYTGGFQLIECASNVRVARLGWNLPKVLNSAETTILMSMLAGRLERSLAEKKISADANVKVAGYFGLRTLCITVKSYVKKDFDAAIKVVLDNITRLETSEASERRMETTRSRAAAERLCISNEALPHSVEAAWSLLGRHIDYDVDSIINNIYDVDAHDVMIAAREIFSQKPTVVLCTRRPCISYDKVVKATAYDKFECKKPAKPAPATQKLSDSERAAMERVDALNAE